MVEKSESTAPSLSKQRERFLIELQHLEQTYKSGMFAEPEYLIAKKAVEKKLHVLEQKIKQSEAKEKAVEEILGSSSILKNQAKHHQKYFMKLEKPKEELQEQSKEQSKEEPLPKKIFKQHLKKFHPSPQKQKHSISTPSVSSPLPSSYQNVDEFVEKEDTNWRFALTILTLFLLILLYVKFTSFGATSDVLPVDVYLDGTSSYSKDMYFVLSQLGAEYGESLLVSYAIIGTQKQSVLLGTALACAAQQDRDREYLAYIFQEVVVLETTDDAIAVATTLGFDTIAFSTCVSDPTIKENYLLLQQEIASYITHTPTLLINNKKVVGAVGYDVIKSVIDAEMTSLG